MSAWLFRQSLEQDLHRGVFVLTSEDLNIRDLAEAVFKNGKPAILQHQPAVAVDQHDILVFQSFQDFHKSTP